MTTYYVDAVDGADINAGTSEGSGNAWQTIQHAEDTVVAGDKVFVKASGNYNEQVTLSLSFSTAQTAVIFEGYTTTPGDNGVAVIDGQSTRSYCITTNFVTKNFRMFKNFRCTGATVTGYHDDSGDNALFINCEFDNNGTDGTLTDNYSMFIYCSFHDNGRYGANAGLYNQFYRCAMYGNTQSGYSGSNAGIVGCLYYENGDAQPDVALNTVGGPNALIVENTIEHNSAQGNDNIIFYRGWPYAFFNNILVNGGTGIDAGTGSMGGVFHAGHNLTFNMATADYDALIEDWAGTVSESDPQFTDAAADDYTVQSGSPAEDAGLTTRTT